MDITKGSRGKKTLLGKKGKINYVCLAVKGIYGKRQLMSAHQDRYTLTHTVLGIIYIIYYLKPELEVFM